MKKTRFLTVFVIVIAAVMEICSLGAVYAAEESDLTVQDHAITENALIPDVVEMEEDPGEDFFTEETTEDPGEDFFTEVTTEDPEEDLLDEEFSEEDAPEEDAPLEETSEEESIEENFQEEETPEDELPEEETEEEETSEESVPEETEEEKTSEETTPEETPEEELPEEETGEDIPEEVPEEDLAEEELTEDNPEETNPEETASEETTLEKDLTEENVPDEIVTENSDPEEILPEETLPEEAFPEAAAEQPEAQPIEQPEELPAEQPAEQPEELPAEPEPEATDSFLIEETITDTTTVVDLTEETVIQAEDAQAEMLVVKSGDGSTAFEMNNIPVIRINIDESNGNTIANMHASEDHSAYCYGTIDIIVPEGYISDYMDAEAISLTGLDLEYIRGRGNSTWQLDKKPYKFKLDKSTDLFGMGKNKHWVLLANRMDDTLVKNRITFWLSDAIGLAYTPQCIPVDVVMNDTYIGSYLLVEQVRVGTSRVNIKELKEAMTEEPDITGGYLLAIGTQDTHDAENYWVTDKGVELITDTPEFAEGEYENDIQRQYIRNYIQAMENAIFGENYSDSEGNSYGKFLDIDSAIDYWWIQALAQNPDGFNTGSTYMYKDREDKLYFGPVWDFDAAWNWSGMSSEGYDAVLLLPWYEAMFTDSSFAERVVSRWYEIRDYVEDLVREGGILDQYYEETKASQQYDEALWGLYKPVNGGDMWDDEEQTEDAASYKDRIEELRTWIINRRDWIDENVDSVLNLVHLVRFMDEDTNLETRYVRDGMRIYQFPEVPEKEGYYFLGWYSEDGTRIDSNMEISDNLVISPVYLENSQVTRGQELYFAESHIYVPSAYYNRSIAYTILPEDAMDKSVVWTSSDESIVTVDADGCIYMQGGLGTVTVTGTLSSGNSYSYTVTVYDWDEVGDDIPVEGVVLDQTAITLQVGEYKHIGAQIEPPFATDYSLEFISEDPTIAEVSSGGIVKGISEGTTRIIVRDKWSDKYTVCLVTVGGEEDPVEPGGDEPVEPEPGGEDPVEPGGDEPIEPEPKNDDPEPKNDVPIEPKDDTPEKEDDGTGEVIIGPTDYEPTRPPRAGSDPIPQAASEYVPGTNSNSVPRTGDEHAAYLWLILMGIATLMISLCILAFAGKTVRKR